jgi:hypothetical protein
MSATAPRFTRGRDDLRVLRVGHSVPTSHYQSSALSAM